MPRPESSFAPRFLLTRRVWLLCAGLLSLLWFSGGAGFHPLAARQPVRPAAAEAAALAMTFTVTKTADTNDGVCDADCSLREAIVAANAAPGNDIIEFDATVFNAPQTITLGGTRLNINNNGSLTINGRKVVTVSGNQQSGVFGVLSGAEVTLNGLIITGGANIGFGGGIGNSGMLTINNSTISGNSADHGGGGLSSNGTVMVNNSTIADNFILATDLVNGLGDGFGGGIYNLGTMTISSSTISGNSGVFGGGIYNGYELTVNNSTISGNTADISPSGGGGGIDNGGTLTMSYSTVTNNTGRSGADGIYTLWGNMTVSYSIIARNPGVDTYGTVTQQGYNLIGGDVDPRLGPLADNGGPTQTHALLPGSPAIDAGNNTGAPATDQRGITRPLDGDNDGTATVDIGAYELYALVVDNTTDDGTLSVCTAAPNDCSLRGAITKANADAGSDLIEFSTTVFATPQTITLGGTQLELTNNGGLTINGRNLVTVSGNDQSRVFQVNGIANVTFNGLTITLGKGDPNGGGIFVFNTNNLLSTVNVINCVIKDSTGGFGGGIYNQTGTTNVINSTLSGNHAIQGGGIALTGGKVTVVNSTLTGNEGPVGGAIFNLAGGDTPATLQVTNSTISGNSANEGGGIYNGDTLTVSHSTIFGNATTADTNGYGGNGGGIYNENGGMVSVGHSIIAGNTAEVLSPDFCGTLASQGYNLIGDPTDTTITGTTTGNLLNQNPLLAPLGNYGGPTPTHALLPGSPALNAGNNSGAPAADQRGIARPQQDTVDIGAFESRGFTLAAANGYNQSARVTLQFSAVLAAKVGSAFDEPVAGGVVTFTAPTSGPSAFLNTNLATINASGFALAQATANSVAGMYQVQAAVIGNNGPSVNFNLTNWCALITVTSVQPTPLTCFGGANGSLTVQASGGIAPLQYSINNGQTFQTSNVFAGLAAGSYTVVVKDVNDCLSAPSPATLTQPAALGLSPAALGSAVAGQPFAQQFTPSGGTGALSVALNSVLPAWLSFNPANAVLSGTAPQAATVSLSLLVTDQAGCTASFNYTLNFVCPAITLTPASLPNGATGTSYQQSLAAQPGGTNYSFAVTQGQLPPGLTLANDGTLSGIPTAGGAFSFAVTAAGWGGCSGTNVYTLLVVAICPTLTVNPASLPNGTADSVYNQSLSASGGAGPYSFAVTGGALPSGLSLNAAGGLSGTPTASGTFSFTVTVTGAAGCTGSRNYTVAVTCPVLSLTPASLPNAQAGVAYNQTVAAPGATNYSLLVGNLPPGFNLNAATGALTGTATATGTFNFTLQAAAPGGCNGTQAYSIVVTCPTVTVNPASLPAGTTGTAYSQSLSATPAGNYSFAKTSGTLPAGLSLSAAGVLSGTPSTQGSYSFTVTATGFGSCSGSRQYTLTITASCATITLPTLPATGKVGVNYSGNLAATTPSASYTFTVESGALPPGLAINNLFGQLSGKPTAAGEYTFTLKAARSNGCTGTREYTVVVSSGTALRTALARTADYDGDGRSDLSLWSESSGRWQIVRSSDEQTTQTAWGAAGDLTLLGDYDGDGLSDLAVFRPGDATFYIKRSSDGSALVKPWGLASDVPVPGDYDGDGQTDVAVFRPSEGNWYVLKSSDGGYLVKAWGLGSAPYLDVPVPGDYDGDGKTDLAVFRRSSGTWLIQRSADGQYTSKTWGVGTDVPVAGDYDGDGKSDLAVWRGATGQWFVLRSSDQGYDSKVWGAASVGDMPAPGDYDGDGRADLAVWRAPEGRWYVWQSGPQDSLARSQGQAGDVPVTSVRLR
jgi:CSLREA domain-containing protein